MNRRWRVRPGEPPQTCSQRRLAGTDSPYLLQEFNGTVLLHASILLLLTLPMGGGSLRMNEEQQLHRPISDPAALHARGPASLAFPAITC